MTAPKVTKKPVSWLVEDLALYPRTRVDDANVASIAEAIRSGAGDEIPPIVAERATGRIVDGFHRRRAWIRVHGDGAVVPVALVDYASEAEAFADAVRRNACHGRKLNSNDETRSALRMQELGIDDGEIATILRISPGRVENLVVKVAVSTAGEPVPLKRGDLHLQGRTVTLEQMSVLNRRLGVPYARLAQQILDGLEQHLLPGDEATWVVLRRLADAIYGGEGEGREAS